MANSAPKAQQLSFLQLPENTTAVGTAVYRWGSRFILILNRIHIHGLDLGFFFHFLRHRPCFWLRFLSREANQQWCDIAFLQAIVDIDSLHGATRHVGKESIRWILDNRYAVTLLHCE